MKGFATYTDDLGYTQVSNGFWKTRHDRNVKTTDELIKEFLKPKSE